MNGGSYKDAVKMTDPVTIHTIFTAKTKPVGVSAVRWRIELARRADKSRFDNSYYRAPNPDWLH